MSRKSTAALYFAPELVLTLFIVLLAVAGYYYGGDWLRVLVDRAAALFDRSIARLKNIGLNTGNASVLGPGPVAGGDGTPSGGGGGDAF